MFDWSVFEILVPVLLLILVSMYIKKQDKKQKRSISGFIWLLVGLVAGSSSSLALKYPESIWFYLFMSFSILSTLVFTITLSRAMYLGEIIRSLMLFLFGIPFYILFFAWVYAAYGILYDGDVTNKFSHCLYFSVVTWTTLGYGDFVPTESVRLYAAAEALIGYVYMGLLVGAVFLFLSDRKIKSGVDISDGFGSKNS